MWAFGSPNMCGSMELCGWGRGALVRAARPIGPAAAEHVTSEELYRAILEREPYAVRGLVGFGANALLSHADGTRGRAALAALDFDVHADLFMSPTAELADIVLPVATPFEREALKVGFDISAEAQSHVQLRRAMIEPRGAARSTLTSCSGWRSTWGSGTCSGTATSTRPIARCSGHPA
jgi:anaerobic selenocysteine-containing dehydrogenase